MDLPGGFISYKKRLRFTINLLKAKRVICIILDDYELPRVWCLMDKAVSFFSFYIRHCTRDESRLSFDAKVNGNRPGQPGTSREWIAESQSLSAGSRISLAALYMPSVGETLAYHIV